MEKKSTLSMWDRAITLHSELVIRDNLIETLQKELGLPYTASENVKDSRTSGWSLS